MEFGFDRVTRHIGMIIRIDARLYQFLGPKSGDVQSWCVGAIDYLVRTRILPESERAPRLASIRETYTNEGYQWGTDDNRTREVPTMARERQSN